LLLAAQAAFPLLPFEADGRRIVCRFDGGELSLVRSRTGNYVCRFHNRLCSIRRIGRDIDAVLGSMRFSLACGSKGLANEQ